MDEQGSETVPSVTHTVRPVGARGYAARRRPGDLAEVWIKFRRCYKDQQVAYDLQQAVDMVATLHASC